jgi:hypothetical protein
MNSGALLNLENLDLQLTDHFGDRQERGVWRGTLEIAVGDFEMGRTDAALSQGGIQGDPHLIDVDFGPHVIKELLAIVDQPDRDTGWNSPCPSQRGQQDAVLGTIALQIAGDFGSRGKSRRDPQERSCSYDPFLQGHCGLPRIVDWPAACWANATTVGVVTLNQVVGLQIPAVVPSG